MCNYLYTDDELIEKIKEADTQLSSGLSKSELDTSQTKNSVTISVRTIERQKEYYMGLLQTQNRELYNCMFGTSVIQFKGNHCV